MDDAMIGLKHGDLSVVVANNVEKRRRQRAVDSALIEVNVANDRVMEAIVNERNGKKRGAHVSVREIQTAMVDMRSDTVDIKIEKLRRSVDNMKRFSMENPKCNVLSAIDSIKREKVARKVEAEDE